MGFMKTALLRDLWPFASGRKVIEVLIQSFLPVIGCFFVILLLSAGAILCHGFYQGYQIHLKALEDDPFSTSIILKGNVKQKQLDDFLGLSWDKDQQKFLLQSDPDFQPDKAVKLVKGGTSYSRIGLYFVDKDGYLTGTFPLIGSSIQLKDQFMKNAIIKLSNNSRIKIDEAYFNDETDDSLIISKSLLNHLAYNSNIKWIRVVAPGVDFSRINIDEYLRDNEGARPMSDKELALYTIRLPVKNIVKNLLRGDFICTENLIARFQRRAPENPYDVRRKIDNFTIVCPDEIPHKEFDNRLTKYLMNKKTGFGNIINKPLPSVREQGKYKTLIRLKQRIPVRDVKASFYKFWKNHFQDQDEVMDSLEIPEPPGLYHKKIRPYYMGAFIYLTQNEIISKHLNKLYRFFIQRTESSVHADLFQLQVLKRYREETDRLQNMTWWLNIAFIIATLIASFVIFLLWVHIRYHKIGVFMAFGGDSIKIGLLYFMEMLIVSGLPVFMSWLIGLLIYPYFFEKYGYSADWLLSPAYIGIILLLMLGLVFTITIGAFYFTRRMMPHEMIGHRE
ncbi:membrane hypothetical protein [Candidatus Magnetomoraceae bacterium gMMP-15]